MKRHTCAEQPITWTRGTGAEMCVYTLLNSSVTNGQTAGSSLLQSRESAAKIP